MNYQDFAGTNPTQGKQGKPKKKRGLIIAAVAVAALMMLMLAGGCENRDKQNDHREMGRKTEERLVPDLDEYYSRNGKLVRKIPVASSTDVRDEKEMTAEIDGRGFSGYPITAEYAMDGTLYEETEVKAEAGVKHPVYTVYYMTSRGDYWALVEINGILIANPVSYNLCSDRQIQVIIAETDTIMSYDSHTGLFYETIPDPSALIVKKVDRIDAETLEKLTAEKVDML